MGQKALSGLSVVFRVSLSLLAVVISAAVVFSLYDNHQTSKALERASHLRQWDMRVLPLFHPVRMALRTKYQDSSLVYELRIDPAPDAQTPVARMMGLEVPGSFTFRLRSGDFINIPISLGEHEAEQRFRLADAVLGIQSLTVSLQDEDGFALLSWDVTRDRMVKELDDSGIPSAFSAQATVPFASVGTYLKAKGWDAMWHDAPISQ